MKIFVKKNWKKILITLGVVFILYRIVSSFFGSEDTTETQAQKTPVEIIDMAMQSGQDFNAFCSVEALTDVSITSEASGKVTSVYVTDGQELVRGEKIASLENIQQRVAVQDATVALRSAELSLSELLKNNNTGNNSSIASQTLEQQEALVENARNTLFNNDLRAYPQDNPDKIDSGVPTVSGNYSCMAEGEYIVEVYASSAPSGASFTFSGLESGRSSVSTTGFGTNLGDCGLELIFPEDFDKTETWVIPVPNTRSSSYTSVLSNYKTVQSGKNITVDTTIASAEQIAQKRAQVNQAALRLESARESLSKTIITAPQSGILGSFDVSEGDYVSMNSDIGRITSPNEVELVTYINAEDVKYIGLDSQVSSDTFKGMVSYISPTIDPDTKKAKVSIDIIENNDEILVEGTETACRISRNLIKTKEGNQNETIIPLSAVSVIGMDYFVFTVQDSIAVAVDIVPGAILGDDIVVYGLQDVENIIRDVRGIHDGDTLVLK